MPQALAIPIATFIGGLGASAAVATVASTIIAGAIVGAAVGGLAAAVTGGDIGKGLLFGAVGGAVTGGISGYMSLGSGATAAATTSTNLAQGTASTSILDAAGGAIEGGSGGLFGGAAGGGGGLLQGAGASLINAGGQMLKGSAEEDMMKEKNTADTAAADKRIAAELEVAKMNDATTRIGQTNQLNVAKDQLAQAKSQFDTGNQLDAERLARQQSAVTDAVVARKGILQGDTASIDEQVYANRKRMVG